MAPCIESFIVLKSLVTDATLPPFLTILPPHSTVLQSTPVLASSSFTVQITRLLHLLPVLQLFPCPLVSSCSMFFTCFLVLLCCTTPLHPLLVLKLHLHTSHLPLPSLSASRLSHTPTLTPSTSCSNQELLKIRTSLHLSTSCDLIPGFGPNKDFAVGSLTDLGLRVQRVVGRACRAIRLNLQLGA